MESLIKESDLLARAMQQGISDALTVEAVRIDLHGSLSLGSQVATFLSQYLKDDLFNGVSGRRSMTDALEELAKVVRHMKPCRNVSDCTPDLEKILINYVSDLTTSVKSVFDGVLEDELCKVKYFQKCLKHVKKVVKNSISDADEVYRWINVLKKISAAFIEQGVLLTKQGLAKVERGGEAINALRQQLVLKITDVEKNYQTKLCNEFRFCPYQFDATIYLQLLLNIIKTTNDSDVKVFLNMFKINFLKAPLFAEDKITKSNFEDILKEMLLNKSVVAKDVVLSIADVVQKRLAVTDSTERDAVLLQIILSDMDHLYSNNQDDFIDKFIDVFKSWLKSKDNDVLRAGMVGFYNSLASHFINQPPELVFKLKTEAQVFLGITAGSTPISTR